MGKKIEICGLNTSSIRRLSAKESFSLLEKIKQGDEKAREFFITANVRLVLSLVKRFDRGKASGDDLFQAGMMGLIKSVDNFDLSVGRQIFHLRRSYDYRRIEEGYARE